MYLLESPVSIYAILKSGDVGILIFIEILQSQVRNFTVKTHVA